MKQIDVTQIIFIVIAMVVGVACTWAVGPIVGKTIKIGARHLAAKGMEKWPLHFAILATISKRACELDKRKELAIQGAFLGIAKVIIKDLEDPLLKADLEDLIDLMGVSLNIDLVLRDVTPDQQKILELVVCEFAKGVKQ